MTNFDGRLVYLFTVFLAILAGPEFACRYVKGHDAIPPAPKLEVTLNGVTGWAVAEYIGHDGNRAKYLLKTGDNSPVMPMLLGSERQLSLHWDSNNADELLYLETPGQPRQLVGARIHEVSRDGKQVLVNPLEKLTDQQIRQLRGVDIWVWTNTVGESLKRIDPDRTVVTIRKGVAEDGSVPLLPAAIKMLQIDPYLDLGPQSLNALQKLTKLTSLTIESFHSDSIDCSVLKQLTGLQHLDLGRNTLRKVSELATLAQLQVFNAHRCEGLTDIGFIKSMSKLEWLNLSSTEVTDLSPLDRLPNLNTVHADITPIRKLPVAVPSLRELSVMSSKLTDADVRTFQQANPQCRVLHRWGDLLVAAVKPATRLEVRSNRKTLFETKKTEEFKQFLTGIEINEEQSGFHCMCNGDPSFEFYNGEQLITSFTFHHGKTFRWEDGWPGDAALTEPSGEFLCRWLANATSQVR